MSNITISLENQTGLDPDNYTIYVMGFSSTSQMQLVISSGTKAKFAPVDSPSGNLNIFTLAEKGSVNNPGITEIDIDQTLAVDGGRIYFFISENSQFPLPPKVAYSGNGSNVVNVPNPPNINYAPYVYTEFTNSPGYGAVIDSQTVDGFTAPVTVVISNGNDVLGSVGQSAGITRENIIAAYSGFIESLPDSGKEAFLDLQYTTNNGGLLNPGAYLNDVSPQGEFNNLDSDLNTYFDQELNTFFNTDNLSIQGVAQGDVSAQVYNTTSVDYQLPDSPFSHQALELKGASDTFYIFNPVGLCLLTDNGQAIKGTIDDLTLTFQNPLSEANIEENMYISGAGIPAGMMWVETVNKSQNKIVSVTMGYNMGTLPPDSEYTFLPKLGISPSGQPTFIGSIVDNTLTFKEPVADTSKVKENFIVEGPGLAGIVSIVGLNTNGAGQIVSVTIKMSLGQPAPGSEYYFSKIKGMFMTSGNMVFANQGLFAYTGGITDPDEQNVLLNLQNQIVSAFNRGVANTGPTSGSGAYTSTHWGTESNWYPENKTQNLFSLFMHTANVEVKGAKGENDNEIPIFIKAPNSSKCARSSTMGQAYGFAYDENPMFVSGQGPVPSKFDPVPVDTTQINITLGKWE